MTQIRKTNKADTRFCKEQPSKEELLKESITHIEDVKSVLKEIGNDYFINSNHDFTKIKNIDQFYNDFINSLNHKINFTEGSWYQNHIKEERHHPEAYVNENINLIDIIEYIVDNVCAGKARSGEVRKLYLDSDILQKAFINTVSFIDNITM